MTTTRTSIASLLLLATCVALHGSSAVAQPRVTVGPPDWFDYQPSAPLEERRFYVEPYASVIYVAEEATLLDGRAVWVVEAIRGNPCGTDAVTAKPRRSCTWPADTPRGHWFPVEVTLEQVVRAGRPVAAHAPR